MDRKIPEGAIQRFILDELSRRGILCWREARIPTPIRQGRRVVGFRKADQYTLGIPDIFCVIRGHLIGIEVKTVTGRQSDDQVEWQRKLEEAGGTYVLARAWEDVERVLDEF